MDVALRKKLVKLLKSYFGSEHNYDLNSGCVYDDALDTLISDIADVFRAYMTPFGAYRIMTAAIWEIEDRYRDQMEAGVEFEESTIREMVINHIAEQFESYPRLYELEVETPHIREHASCDYHLTDGVEIIPGHCSIKLDGKKAIIKIKLSGYCDPSLGSDSIAGGLKELKVFAFLLRWRKFASFISMADVAGAKLLDCHTNVQQPIALPREAAFLLGSLRLNLQPLLIHGQLNTRRDLAPRAKVLFEEIGSMMQELATRENDSLTTAIEWLMDSMFVENQTVAFLEVCIGIEALLGEEGQMSEMTSRLCDRLAFLLGKSRQERGELWKQYRSILDLRGKLVHSKKARLSYEDGLLLESARRLLERVITVELDCLKPQ